MIIRKSPAEIEKMAKAGEILVATLELLESSIRAGVSTAELDEIAERFIRSRGRPPRSRATVAFPPRSVPPPTR